MSSVEADLLAASLLLRSNPAEAARRADLLLQRVPGHVQASLLLALASLRSSDGTRAVAVLESLAAQQPDSAVTRLELGKAYLACARKADALLAFGQAVELDGRLAEAWRELSAQLDAAGRTVDSDRAYARYCELRREPAQLTDARAALAENRLRSADTLLMRRLDIAPDDVVARHMLAEVAMRRDNNPAAERLLYECVNLAPGFAAARFDLVRTLHAQQKHQESLMHVERLLAAHPDRLEYIELQAQTLRFLGRNAEGMEALRLACERDPGNAETWLHYGQLLREVGESDRSIETYRRALAADPDRGARTGVSPISRHFASPNRMSRRCESSATTRSSRPATGFRSSSPWARRWRMPRYSNAHSSIMPSAMRCTDPPSSMTRTPVSEDVRRCRTLHTREFFSERAGWGSPRRDPIFIVGMPRSGSTLLEQILASHSQIEATLELADIPNMVIELMASDVSQRYPTALTALGRHSAEAYANRYLDQTQPRRTAATPRFVDKMLGNFAFVGFIHLLFPNASIIDIRRHPMASCFACSSSSLPVD